MSVIEAKYPFIKEAEKILGIKRQRKLDYNTTKIKRELIKLSDKPIAKKIIELVIERIGYQKPIDNGKAKDILQEVYNSLGIKIVATTSKLKDYFIIKEFTVSREGRSVRQIELIKEKFNLDG